MKRPVLVGKGDAIPSLRPVVAAKGDAVKPDLVEVFDDVEQNTPEWFDLRLGIATASNFATVMATGKDGGDSKTRSLLMRKLAGEILTGKPAESFSNAYMERGNAMEAEAREHFAFTNDVEPIRVGFVRRTIHRTVGPPLVVGCSPDSLLGNDGVLEIKTMAPHLMIELSESGRFPSEHRAQAQGSLWVTGRSVCKLRIFFSGMPYTIPFTVERDDGYIATIRDAVETFDYELRQLVKRQRERGK